VGIVAAANVSQAHLQALAVFEILYKLTDLLMV
jgi:hypothetical protein